MDKVNMIADEALNYSRAYNVPLDSAIFRTVNTYEHLAGDSLSNNGLAAVKLLIAQKLKGPNESDEGALKRFFKAD